MKILFLTPRGKRKNTYSQHDTEYDLDSVSNIIKENIVDNIPNVEVSFAYEIANQLSCWVETIKGYDLVLCDLTTHNSNYTYLAGLAEGIGKVVIYFCTNDHPPTTVLESKNVLQYSPASLEHEFKERLYAIINEFIKDPSSLLKENNIKSSKPKAFISYSHRDHEFLDRLMVHLKPLEIMGMLDVWQDNQIKLGDNWSDKIGEALNEASVAILLISADFMASDFILENELPPILSQAEVSGTKVIPVILSHCRFVREPTLNRFQAANNPSKPLSVLSEEDREAIYDKLAAEIESALSVI